MSKRSRAAELQRMIDAAVDHGWTVVKKASNVQLRAPDKATIVTVHLTESDHRANANTRSRLRRAGVDV